MLKRIGAIENEDEINMEIHGLCREWRLVARSKDFETYFQSQYMKQHPPQQSAQYYVKDGGPTTNMENIRDFRQTVKIQRIGSEADGTLGCAD